MKCCILAAGKGTRLGRWSDITHKALLPLGEKAILSRIIETFPNCVEFVIPLGSRGDLIREYCAIAHSDAPIRFVEVDLFEGPGSGPGRSLWCAREFLNEPFLFTACDTLVSSPLPPLTENWIGTVEVADVSTWCSALAASDGRISKLVYKQPAPTKLAFTGIAFVRDTREFWEALAPASDAQLLQGELQVNNGLNGLIPRGLFARPVDWIDTGSAENYAAAQRRFGGSLSFEGKTTDLTYRIADRIVKYFPNAKSAQNRFARGTAHPDAFAEVGELHGHFFSSRFYQGELLSARQSYSTTASFLRWVSDTFWRNRTLPEQTWHGLLVSFYRTKTLTRLAEYCKRFGGEQEELTINGERCRSVSALVEIIPDAFFQDGQPSTFHGDLHDDNILCVTDGFRLIDWREDFGGNLECGDRYYDLAKFLHTLELSVETMRSGDFEGKIAGENATLRHTQQAAAVEAQRAFWDFIRSEGYDRRRVELVDALIFINMAPLYEERMAQYLYLVGRLGLTRALAKVLDDSKLETQ